MSPSQLKPTGQRILIELVVPERTIISPDKSVPPDAKIMVRAIGPQVTACAVGDQILLLPDVNLISGPEIKPFMAIHESNILAIIAPGEPQL